MLRELAVGHHGKSRNPAIHQTASHSPSLFHLPSHFRCCLGQIFIEISQISSEIPWNPVTLRALRHHSGTVAVEVMPLTSSLFESACLRWFILVLRCWWSKNYCLADFMESNRSGHLLSLIFCYSVSSFFILTGYLNGGRFGMFWIWPKNVYSGNLNLFRRTSFLLWCLHCFVLFIWL